MISFFIRRPVFTICAFSLLILGGVFSFLKLNICQYPNMSGDTIMIMTHYNGANASTMETLVTTPIENALQGIDGVDYISSSSSSNSSRIVVNLMVNADENKAVTEIESAISSVKSKLPKGIDDPIIREADSSSMPDLVLSFMSDRISTGAISDYLTRVLTPSLSNIDGVGEVQIMGNRQYALRIWLNLSKMRNDSITMSDLQNALNNQNVYATAGEIDRKDQIITIDAGTDGRTVDDFKNLVVKTVGNKTITLNEIADVTLGAENTTSSMFTDGKPAVGLAITYKNDANPLSSEKLITEALSHVSLPQGMSEKIIRNSTTFIQSSLNDILITLIITLISVLAVIILFLGRFRLVLIPFATIPLSIVGSFIFMQVCGFSINLLTLLAFVLAIGLVVDDAIVVMENIHRHQIMGKSPLNAAIDGSREIFIAIIAITITLLAVFAPIGFDSGITGALFKEFAFTLAFTVLISGIVALFFSPMMCRFLVNDEKANRFSQLIDHQIDRLQYGYEKLLRLIIDQKKIILLIIFFILTLGVTCFYLLVQTSQLAPDEDQSIIIGMAKGPTSASLNYTQHYSDQIPKITKEINAIENTTIINGFPSGQSAAMIMLQLKNWGDRSLSANQIVSQLMPKIDDITGMKIMLSSPPALPVSKGIYGFEFVIKTTGSYESLNEVVNKIMSAAESNPNILNTQVDLHIDQPQLNLKIDKQKANALGVSMADIASSLSIAFGQPENNEFTLNGYAYYVIPQLKDSQRNNQDMIDLLTVKSASGKEIPLSTFVRLTQSITSSSWGHFQGQRSATISAQLANGYSSEEALNYFQSLANKYLGASGLIIDFVYPYTKSN
ncbi:MAG: efflux RND transporter permease subunit, partial [Francisellaceae bacterium]